MSLASLRIPTTIAAALVGLFDLVAAVQIYVHGYPKHIALTETLPGTAIVTVHKVPFTYTDWLASLALVSFLKRDCSILCKGRGEAQLTIKPTTGV